MLSRWKISFWISIFLLLLTNLFWMYQVLDNAVGMTYYKDSCEKYQSDMLRLKRVLDSKRTKAATIQFLNQQKIEFDSLPKSDEFIIQLGSIDMVFNKDGQLVSSETR